MKALSVQQLHESFDELCSRIDGGSAYRTWFRESPFHDGSAHVEVEGLFYCYVITERGIELERRRTQDSSEILRWLILDVTSDIALKHELSHRRSDEDFRRLYFSKQEHLLRGLKVEWADQFRAEREQLIKFPRFNEAAG